MSSKGGKWVSQRVQQHQQQTVPAPAAAGASVPRHAAGAGATNAPPGSKIMEDSAIAAQRIKESQAIGTRPRPTAEVPVVTVFERQEATDALSNLTHNDEWVLYEKKGAERVFVPAQTTTEFNEKMMKELQSLEK